MLTHPSPSVECLGSQRDNACEYPDAKCRAAFDKIYNESVRTSFQSWLNQVLGFLLFRFNLIYFVHLIPVYFHPLMSQVYIAVEDKI